MITVRRMTKEDLSAVWETEKACFSMPWSYSDFEDIVERQDAIYLVALYDNKIVGHCGVINIVGEGEVMNVAVLPQMRGLHIAQTMLIQLLEEGAQGGIEAFTLEVRSGNESAIHIYKKLGFCIEGVRKNFYQKPVEDALIMWKR